MRAALSIVVLLAVASVPLAGCEVTAEKIETWKGTKNGPKKLAGAVIDPEVPIELRGQACVALAEIREWELLRGVFERIQPEAAAAVVEAAAPLLAELVKGAGGGEPLTHQQIDAKDALVILMDHARGAGLEQVRAALIDWCVGDYNNRAMVGQYNIKTIVRKLGAPGAEALVPLLNLDEITIQYVAELIREVDDAPALAAASKQIAGELKGNVGKIRELHLLSAAIIGGDAVADTLLELASDPQLGAELKRFALRAFSESLERKAVTLNDARVDRLFAMAEDGEQDRYQREETYYVIAQGNRPQDLPRIEKLLDEEDLFWPQVAVRCILRIDGEGQLGPLMDRLGRLKLVKDDEAVNGVIDLVVAFPALKDQVRALLDGDGVFARAVAVSALAAIGNLREDKERLEGLASDRAKLPKGFAYKTLGEASRAALEAIEKRG